MIYFASHTVTIRRLRPYGATIQNFSATFTTYQADIQPLDVNRTNMAGGRIGTLYECFLPPEVPIAEGDQISASGRLYGVQAVNRYEGSGLLEHLHCIIVAQD